MTRRAVAVVAAAAVLAAGCSPGEPVVADEAAMVEAVLATLGGSWRATGTVGEQVDVGELVGALARSPGLVDDLAAGGDTDPDAVAADLREALASLADDAVELARGDDGSLRVAVSRDGVPWVDLRLGPGRTSLSGALDVRLADEVAPVLGVGQLAVAWQSLRLLTPPELRDAADAVDALLDGQWVTVAGLPGTDAAADTGTDAAGDGRGAADRIAALVDLDGFRVADGMTVADLTLRPRAAAAAAPGLADLPLLGALASPAGLPAALADVGRVGLDDEGRLVELRIDLLDLTAALVGDRSMLPPRVAALLELAGDLDRTGAFVTLRFTDHGEVGPQTVEGDGAVDAGDLLPLLGPVLPPALAALLGVPAATASDGGPTVNEDALDDALGQVLGDAGGSPLLTGGLLTGADAGDCLDDGALFGGDAVTVPCDEPHRNQVAAVATLPDGAYDLDRLRAAAGELCTPEVAAWLGGPAGGDPWLQGELVPSAEQWADGERRTQCFVFTVRPTTGSAQGALADG